MIRVIEDLVEKRKTRQNELKARLDELAAALEKRGFLKRNGKNIQESLSRVRAALTEYVTAQDREWDAYSNNHASSIFKSLQWKIEKLESEYSNLKTLLIHFAQLENKLDRLLESFDLRPTPEAADELYAVKEQLSPFQYADFERRFRGSHEEVAGRLARYVPLFIAGGEVLDIGCGRGEFLSLLHNSGRHPLGLDLSDSMLEEARARGLACVKADAIDFLKARPDASLDGIFSSQVIEHFEPGYLRRVVAECFRVLRPGAVLLLETINPLSLFALSRIYFLDPTHQRPLHPEYMRYLLENSGFAAVEILYGSDPGEEKLAEADPTAPQALPFNQNVDRLNRLLFSPSEYAVKGLKPPAPKGPGRRDPQGPSSRPGGAVRP
ncbi:MAG: methyltransferase domain-containing protein [Candidatus Aminicenantes bacterium]|nr:methyltransferase domain-containing protein [Candidatus Aminicenantes bacterium]